MILGEEVCNLVGGENTTERNTPGKKMPADDVGFNLNVLCALLKYWVVGYIDGTNVTEN